MSNEPDELEVKTPAGSFRARGTDMISLVSVLAICAVLFMVYQQGIDAKAARIEVAGVLTKVAQSQEELGYLVSLTAEQRTKLNMDMPESLRKRLRDR